MRPLILLAGFLLVAAELGAAPPPFRQTLKLQGITFKVECVKTGSGNNLTVTPKGLGRDNRKIQTKIDGTVVKAQVADLNGDGSPELYVFVRSDGSGSYGRVAAWSANRRLSLTEIFVPEPAEVSKKAAKGYRGHDEFDIVEGCLVRRFPIYRQGDVNAAPTGKTRQIQYKLHAGEAGWVMRPDKVVDF